MPRTRTKAIRAQALSWQQAFVLPVSGLLLLSLMALVR
jgi:hypothetical protein